MTPAEINGDYAAWLDNLSADYDDVFDPEYHAWLDSLYSRDLPTDAEIDARARSLGIDNPF